MDVKNVTSKSQPRKITTKKSSISFTFDKSNGSAVQRCLAHDSGLDIPPHRFMRDTTESLITTIEKNEAKDILRYYNIGNRKTSQAYTKMYAAEFLAGDWKFNGEALKFANGTSKDVPYRLLDGQNRLAGFVLACETAEKEGMTPPTFQTVVCMGLQDDTQKKMDRNFKRSVKSLFHFSDVAGVNNLAYSLACHVAKMGKLTEVQGLVSDRDLKNVFSSYKESINSVASQLAKGVAGVKKMGVNIALVFYHKQNPAKAESFINQLVEGENLTKGDPALALRNYIIKNKAYSGKRSYGLDTEAYGKTITAIIAHSENKSLMKLQVSKLINDIGWINDIQPPEKEDISNRVSIDSELLMEKE